MLDSQDLSYFKYLFSIFSNTEMSFKKYVKPSKVAISFSLRNKETVIQYQNLNSLSFITSSNKLQSSGKIKAKIASTISLCLVQ